MNDRALVVLNGGLGNQLFQLAAAMFHGRDVSLIQNMGNVRTDKENIPDLLAYRLPPRVRTVRVSGRRTLTRMSNHLLFRGARRQDMAGLRRLLPHCLRLGLGVQGILCSQLVVGQGLGFCEIPAGWGSALLIGFFQTYRWASRPDILQQLRNLELVEPDGLDSWRELAEVERPLVVHVRLTDYKQVSFGIPTPAYYATAIREALAEASEYGAIWLFSDALDEARSFLPEHLELPLRNVDTTGQSPAYTLDVMRLGRGFVIANSSFSWWGSFLSRHQGARVIAPTPWFSDCESPRDISPPHWKCLPRL
jgi:hypothetical protein